jgi:excisionase family DNA binding protein
MSAPTNGSLQSFDDIPLITEDDLDALFGQVRFVNVKELARFLGLSPKTIYNHIKRGNIKVLRVGRNIRISREAVRCLLNNTRD